MGGRTKPNWTVFEGGPLHGERRLLPPTHGTGPFTVHAPSPATGQLVVHVYDLTSDYRRGERDGGLRLAPARIARYVRALPDEPIPTEPEGDA
jgi:hypothetical protein